MQACQDSTSHAAFCACPYEHVSMHPAPKKKTSFFHRLNSWPSRINLQHCNMFTHQAINRLNPYTLMISCACPPCERVRVTRLWQSSEAQGMALYWNHQSIQLFDVPNYKGYPAMLYLIWCAFVGLAFGFSRAGNVSKAANFLIVSGLVWWSLVEENLEALPNSLWVNRLGKK